VPVHLPLWGAGPLHLSPICWVAIASGSGRVHLSPHAASAHLGRSNTIGNIGSSMHCLFLLRTHCIAMLALGPKTTAGCTDQRHCEIQLHAHRTHTTVHAIARACSNLYHTVHMQQCALWHTHRHGCIIIPTATRMHHAVLQPSARTIAGMQLGKPRALHSTPSAARHAATQACCVVNHSNSHNPATASMATTTCHSHNQAAAN
jgi:hypothetical protein